MTPATKLDATKPITDEDIRVLVRHPDAERRAVIAQKVCRRVRDHDLTPGERRVANEVLGFIADDAASLVRRALAITLKNSPELPRDLALKLAADIAVAKRPAVSGSVVENIVRYGDSKAVAELAANDGADISPEAAKQMLDAYRDDDLIAQAFIRRRDLPIGIVEKLVARVSEEAAFELTKRHALPVELAIELASRARERATIDIIDQSTKTKDVALLARRLEEEGRLTPSLIIRAAGCGEMRFVEHALAVKANISHSKAALMVHDSGPFSLQALCKHAAISETSARVLRAACVIYRDLELSGVTYDRAYFRETMILRILTLPLSLDESDQLYFLEKLDGIEVEGCKGHISTLYTLNMTKKTVILARKNVI